ncbi:hypothetical protein HPB52_000182 [Rhipicephalus sanguineus]|uniref:Uncharacterized protein n=1 Tax=Rhipicephalus sanguineus TaxID=34632 RepID=A0A9D4PQ88_RHISA|nr:hypothetical protein HPB52_000182 [Rhipicephalus sanguineus]
MGSVDYGRSSTTPRSGLDEQTLRISSFPRWVLVFLVFWVLEVCDAPYGELSLTLQPSLSASSQRRRLRPETALATMETVECTDINPEEFNVRGQGRPRGGIVRLLKYGSAYLADAIFCAAGVSLDAAGEDVFSMNSKQHTILLATINAERKRKYADLKLLMFEGEKIEVTTYVATLEDCGEGVVHEVPLTYSDADILQRLRTYGNSPVLGQPPQGHSCEPKCQLCGKEHPLGDRKCREHYRVPYEVKKKQWERKIKMRQQRQLQKQQPAGETAEGTPQGRSKEKREREDFCATKDSFPRLEETTEQQHGHSSTRTRGHSGSRPRERSSSRDPAQPWPRKRSQSKDQTSASFGSRVSQANDKQAEEIDKLRKEVGALKEDPKGRQLWEDAHELGLTLHPDSSSPSRVGNSVCADTSPDLTFNKNVTDLKWKNSECNFGSDHFILALILKKGATTRRARHPRITDWEIFRDKRDQSATDKIENIEKWTKTLTRHAEEATKTFDGDDDPEIADSKLLHIITRLPMRSSTHPSRRRMLGLKYWD